MILGKDGEQRLDFGKDGDQWLVVGNYVNQSLETMVISDWMLNNGDQGLDFWEDGDQ